MRTFVKMAHRSDRREDKPRNLVNSRFRPDVWLLARDFHFGQERKGSIPANLLHTKAGDTSVGLTHRLRRQAHDQLWYTTFRGPTVLVFGRICGWTVAHRPSIGPRCSPASRLPSLRSAAAPALTPAALRGLGSCGRWANGGSGQPGQVNRVTLGKPKVFHNNKVLAFNFVARFSRVQTTNRFFAEEVTVLT